MGREAVEAGTDVIMLDNMEHDTMKKAVEIIDGRAEIEISGNVTKENISKLFFVIPIRFKDSVPSNRR